jgi:tetratricopeptide (TPR) repeat protein
MGKKTFLMFFLMVVLLVCLGTQNIKESYEKAIQLGIMGKFNESRARLEMILIEDPFYIRAKRGLDLLNDLADLKVTPQAAKLLFLGWKYSYEREWNEAINVNSKASQLAPNYYYVYHNLGIAFYEKREMVIAIRHYETAITLNPNYPYTYNNLGLAYDKIEKYDKAIGFYNKALDLDPDYYKVYNNMGATYAAKGDKLMANDCFSRALNINPDYTLAMQNYTPKWEEFLNENIDRVGELDHKSLDELVELLQQSNWKDRVLISLILKSISPN